MGIKANSLHHTQVRHTTNTKFSNKIDIKLAKNETKHYEKS